MWQCRCGERNLAIDARCRACDGARSLVEEADPEYRPPKRWKAVQVGFFGFGIDDPRAPESPEAPPATDEELAAYYREAERRNRWSWVLYVAAALILVGLLAWQILRRE